MTQDELVEAVVVATRRRQEAKTAILAAQEEYRSADDGLSSAWGALRDYQDNLVADRMMAQSA